ncbi:MAG: LysM peptidoglycan-binding domain-containing protein [Bacillota bacterium]
MSVQIPPPPPVCPGQIYTVQYGDTLFLIAQRFNVPLNDLIEANPQITNPALILPGQQICIPTLPVQYCLVLEPPAGVSPAGEEGVFLLRAFGTARTDILVAARGLPDPAVFGATAYTTVLSWDRVTFDVPMSPIPNLPGVWVGSVTQRETFPAAFFARGSVDIFPGPVLGAPASECL